MLYYIHISLVRCVSLSRSIALTYIYWNLPKKNSDCLGACFVEQLSKYWKTEEQLHCVSDLLLVLGACFTLISKRHYVNVVTLLIQAKYTRPVYILYNKYQYIGIYTLLEATEETGTIRYTNISATSIRNAIRPLL